MTHKQFTKKQHTVSPIGLLLPSVQSKQGKKIDASTGPLPDNVLDPVSDADISQCLLHKDESRLDKPKIQHGKETKGNGRMRKEKVTLGKFNRIVKGDSRAALCALPEGLVDLSFWSPPYYVGKSYEKGMSFDDWKQLIQGVVKEHGRILKPGGFMVVNIGDVLCFVDSNMPRFQANNVRGKRHAITLDEIQKMKSRYPNATRYELAKLLGCSEQTIQRRVEGNNVRGSKAEYATKVMLTGSLLTEWAEQYGLYLYDKRIWWKDPCWINSRWHSTSYRAVDEFEHIYVYWRPGVVEYDRERLLPKEWSKWGSRGVWQIPSVRKNHRHEAEFPEELAYRVIRLFSPVGGVVIDPFVGSGTTTAVAKKLKRQWLGVDSDGASVKLARRRTNDA